jgi:hypothetical protein
MSGAAAVKGARRASTVTASMGTAGEAGGGRRKL